jgi:hypothetical protein
MSAASMAYAFGGHGVFPEEHREMRDPERWPEVMNWMYAIIMPMYAFSAVAGEFTRHRMFCDDEEPDLARKPWAHRDTGLSV